MVAVVDSHGVTSGAWAVAAKEAYMIYLRTPYTTSGVSSDLMWRMLDFVSYVLPLLNQLVDRSGGLAFMVEMERSGGMSPCGDARWCCFLSCPAPEHRVLNNLLLVQIW